MYDPTGEKGRIGRGARRCWIQGGTGGADWCERQTVLPLHIYWKRQASWVACSEGGHCANAFRMGSSDPSVTAKYCACASVFFLARSISLSVDHTDEISLATPGCVAIVDRFNLSGYNVCAKIIHYIINKHDYMSRNNSICKLLLKLQYAEQREDPFVCRCAKE